MESIEQDKDERINKDVNSTESATAPSIYSIHFVILIGALFVAIGLFFFLSATNSLNHEGTESYSQIRNFPNSEIILQDQIVESRNSSLYVSSDSNNIVYTFLNDGKWFVFANGELSQGFDLISYETVSDDQDLVVAVGSRLKKEFILVNGVPSRPYDAVLYTPRISLNGEHYAAGVVIGNKKISILDGVEVFESISQSPHVTLFNEGPLFSKDGTRVVFIVEKGTGQYSFLIVDTVSKSVLNEIPSDNPRSGFAISNDGSKFGYFEKGNVVILDLETKRSMSFLIDGLTTADLGPIVFSPDGTHWAAFGEQKLWIDGNEAQIPDLKKLGNPVSLFNVRRTLLFDSENRRLMHEVSAEGGGIIVYDLTGHISHVYAGSNSSTVPPNGRIAFLTDGTVGEFLLDGEILIDGKASTLSVDDVRKLLTYEDLWMIYELSLAESNAIHFIKGKSGLELSIQANARDLYQAIQEDLPYKLYVQYKNSSSSAYDNISMPIIEPNGEYFSFGSISSGEITYNIYRIDNGALIKQPISSSNPRYAITFDRIFGHDELGDITGIPIEKSFDVGIPPSIQGISFDMVFKKPADALVTVSIDEDILGSFYQGDFVTTTTTNVVPFSKEYVGTHTIKFRIENLKKEVRAEVQIDNLHFLEIQTE